VVAQNGIVSVANPVALGSVLQPPELRWSVPSSGAWNRAAAVGPGGRIAFATLNAGVGSYDRLGGLEWQSFGSGDTRSGVMLGIDGTLFHLTGDGMLQAWTEDGLVRWQTALGGVSAVPAAMATDGTVYVALIDRSLVAVGPDGKERWRFSTPSEIWSAPAVLGNGNICVVSMGNVSESTGRRDGRVHVLHPNGELLWEHPLGDGCTTSPAIVEDGTLILGTLSGRLVALRSDGTVRWDTPTGGIFQENEPIIGADGTILLGQEILEPETGIPRGRMLAFRPDGSFRWEFPVDAPVVSTAAVTADGTVYFTSESRTLWAVNSNATLRFSYPMELPRGASPTLGYDGTLYLAGGGVGEVRALIGHDVPAKSPWPMARRDFRRSGNAASALVPETWSFPIAVNAFDDAVRALAVHGSNLFAGGEFRFAGGVEARHVARWNGQHWSPLGDGLAGPVMALSIFQGELYAGGAMGFSGGGEPKGIARWDGSRWVGLGGGVDDAVVCLLPWGNSLVIGGYFRTIEGREIPGIARWDGTAWHSIGNDVKSEVTALASDGRRLFAGGSGELGTFSEPLGTVAQWDGERWTRVGARPPNGTIRALAWYQGQLVAAGEFDAADGQTTRGLALFDGVRWRALGGGLGDPVLPYGFSLLADGTDLWVGGTFSRAGTNRANRIARWTGEDWSVPGTGFDRGSLRSAPLVQAMVLHGGHMMAAGMFRSADGNSRIRHLAKWGPDGWREVGPPLGWSEDGAFGLTLQTDRGVTTSIEVSEDLLSWRRWVTLTNRTGPLRINDTESRTSTRRFYRAVSP